MRLPERVAKSIKLLSKWMLFCIGILVWVMPARLMTCDNGGTENNLDPEGQTINRLIRNYELNFVKETAMSFLKAFLKDESGATMIEYGLVAALVSVAAIIALQILGLQLQIIFNTVSSYLSSAATGPT